MSARAPNPGNSVIGNSDTDTIEKKASRASKHVSSSGAKESYASWAEWCGGRRAAGNGQLGSYQVGSLLASWSADEWRIREPMLVAAFALRAGCMDGYGDKGSSPKKLWSKLMLSTRAKRVCKPGW